MRSKLSRLILFAALGFLARPAHAWLWQEVPDKTVTVRYRLAVAANVSTAAVVVDLSDTVNWPHKDAGEINISTLRIEVDKAAASTETVKLGVVNFVDSSTGSVTWFHTQESGINVSNTNVQENVNYTPNFLRLRANAASTPQTNGTTPYLMSNDTTSGSTIYQTDVNLPSPNTVTAPGPGDIVLGVTNGTAAITVSVEIQYHSNVR